MFIPLSPLRAEPHGLVPTTNIPTNLSNHFYNVARDTQYWQSNERLNQAQVEYYQNQDRTRAITEMNAAYGHYNAAEQLARLAADLAEKAGDTVQRDKALELVDTLADFKRTFLDDANGRVTQTIRSQADEIDDAIIAAGENPDTVEITLSAPSGDVVVTSIDTDQDGVDDPGYENGTWTSVAGENEDGTTTVSSSSSDQTVTLSTDTNCLSGCEHLDDDTLFPNYDSYSSAASAYGFGGYGSGGGYGGGEGGVWGDPHYIDLTNTSHDPQKMDYDVMGSPGKVFNILSDQHIQLNNLYEKSKVSNATMVGAAGIKLVDDLGKTHKVKFSRNSLPRLDGKSLKNGQTKTFSMQGRLTAISYDHSGLRIVTPEYVLHLADRGDSLDQRIQLQPGGVFTDNVPPHGLLGQTADGDSNIRHGKIGPGAQGEGAIDFSYDKYQVNSLFDDPAPEINRFQIETQLSFDSEGISRIRNSTNGKLLATRDLYGQLVSVRYQLTTASGEQLTLADGNTQIDHTGKLLMPTQTALATLTDSKP
jgi:hypothetical protein